MLWHASDGGRDDGWRGLEGLGDGHVAVLHVFEVCLPGNVDAGRIVTPGQVHLVDVVCGVSLEEGIVGIL